jgi:hypothetical protein
MQESSWQRLENLEICSTVIEPGTELVARQALVAALRCMPRLATIHFMSNRWMRDADVLAIVEMPQLALRTFRITEVGPAAVRAIAAASWPLEEVELRDCDLNSDAACPAELHRHARLRILKMGECGPGVYEAMANVHWPALDYLRMSWNIGPVERPTLEQARVWAPALREFDLI